MSKGPKKVSGVDILRSSVAQYLPDADEPTQRLVVGLCGLVASVAFIDRQYTAEERTHVRTVLSSVHGLSAAGADAICDLLEAHVVEIATTNTHQYSRDVRDHAEVAVRRDVLDVLVDLAASDDTLSLGETDLLRRTASALGLSQDDYVHAQARHRDKIALLR
jgi:uncharacterized tellurite resistance protein B-like protein